MTCYYLAIRIIVHVVTVYLLVLLIDKCCTNSKYSHAAMIIEKEHEIMLNPKLDQEEYYILQSSYESFPDA